MLLFHPIDLKIKFASNFKAMFKAYFVFKVMMIIQYFLIKFIKKKTQLKTLLKPLIFSKFPKINLHLSPESLLQSLYRIRYLEILRIPMPEVGCLIEISLIMPGVVE